MFESITNRVIRFARTAQYVILASIASNLICGGSTFAQESVVFAGWGGNLQDMQRKIIFEPFEKATGIKVVDVPGVDLAKIKAMVEANNVQWDVVQTDDDWIGIGAAARLWEEVNYNIVNKDGVPDVLANKYGIAWGSFGLAIAYNTNAYTSKQAPKSWADFWDTDKFPGARGFIDQPKYALEFALLADGVPVDKLYPLDVDRAFRSLDKIKNKIHIWSKEFAGIPIVLASAEIAATPATTARILLLQKTDNAPLEVSWTGGRIQFDYVAVPRGSKNKTNAMKLIAYMNKPDVQAEVAKALLIGPANEKALELLSDAEKEQLPTYHYQKGEMWLFNEEWWVEHDAAMQEKWNEWKLK